MNIQKRRFQQKWTQEFPWIRYSESEDGIYCAPCFLFSGYHFNDEFVKSPFKDWKNATDTSCDTLCRHSSSRCHLRCKKQAVTFIAVMERRRPSVKSHLSDACSKQVEQNTKALLSIIDAIQFLVKQGLPLRGHHWNEDLKREDGNLSKLIDFLSYYCSDLNLVIVASCQNVPDIRNFMDSLKELTLFFKYSAKRKLILKEHLKNDKDHEDLLADLHEEEIVPNRRYLGLSVLCDTCWLTRVDSIHCLLKHYRAVCKALETVRERSCGQSASDADTFLMHLLSFEFLASAVICHHVLAYTRPLTVALQAKSCDLLKAFRIAHTLRRTLIAERGEDSKFLRLWQKIIETAQSLSVEPSKKKNSSQAAKSFQSTCQ